MLVAYYIIKKLGEKKKQKKNLLRKIYAIVRNDFFDKFCCFFINFG